MVFCVVFQRAILKRFLSFCGELSYTSITFFMYNNSSPPKKRHHNSFDSDMPPLGLPRKKFISEESFAKDMAAMSLDTMTPAMMQQTQQSSTQDEEEEEEEDLNTYMTLDTTNGKPLIDIDANGLPVELRPGENKPRIPQFVLENPELLDPRDKLAYQKMMQTLYNKQKHIEILNSPSTHYTPTSMDID
ncbi:unnamed protein product [Mucor hiemalis]